MVSKLERVEGLRDTILQAVKEGKDFLNIIIGQEEAKERILASLLANHHILIEGPPGVGKTTLARHIASSLPVLKTVRGCPYHCSPEAPVCPTCKRKVTSDEDIETELTPGRQRFVRLQGSPDLTAEDLLGDIDPTQAFKYGPQDYRAFTPGKLLKANRGIVFFDELNRVPEKLQNALLQVLEEGGATIGPYEVDYPANFLMIATMNPREHAGVEELSDVLMDRFDVIKMGYPESPEREKEIIKLYGAEIEGIGVPEKVLDSIVSLTRATREEPWLKELEQPASVRASLSLYEKAQAMALLRKHSSATIEDVKQVAVSAMGGRIKPSPESKFYDEPFALINEIVDDVLRGR